MELPKKKIAPENNNPRFFIIFSKPKMGKTSLLAQLENNLIIDMEDGSDYVEALKIKVNNAGELREVAEAIKAEGNPYEYITLDTATALEEMILPVARSMYRNTPVGKNFGLDKDTGEYDDSDIRTLANGGGYLWIRLAFLKVIDMFKGLTNHLILTAPTKERMINRDGKEMSEHLMDLSGKLERIVASKADAIGFLYRKKNQNIINFNGGEDLIVEARPPHLRGKEIVLGESDESGIITSHWDKIFKE